MSTDGMISIFGEVLFDYFPDGNRILGGAPFNVAWHLQAFGQRPYLISRVGNDPEGRAIAELMARWGLATVGLQTDHEHPTGSVDVVIEQGEPLYTIVPDCAYDFIEPDTSQTEGILYHGTLAVRGETSRAALQAIKNAHAGKLFVDINLRPPWWHRDTLEPILNDADWIKLNEIELNELITEKGTLETNLKAFFDQFQPDWVVLTRGEEGAVLYDGHDFFTVKPPSNIAVVDTVGAGDAFAAVMLLGLNKSWPPSQMLERAQTFAAAVVGVQGATVFDDEFYQPFIEQWQL